jgi:CHAD domain-containing protein
MERRTQESQANLRKEFNDFLLAYRQERKVFLERIHDAEDTIDGFRTAFDMFGQNYEDDRKALGECVGKLQESLDEIKDSAIERNKEEARMFEGISNMMNYDISTAREAVKDVG